jgi:hypothetical protein
MDNQTAPVSSAAQRDELVSMLGVIASQIQSAMRETDGPATTLVDRAFAGQGNADGGGLPVRLLRITRPGISGPDDAAR